VALAGLDPKCSADGTQRAVQVRPLSDDTVRFAVTCPTPVVDTTTTLPGYQLRNAWGAIAAGRVTLTISLDMGAYNDPAVNGTGPDDIYALQGSTRYDSTALRFVSAANVSGSGLQNLAAGGGRRGEVQWANFTTLTAPQTGLHGVAVITFDVIATTGTAATRTEVSIAQSRSEADLLPHLAVREAVLAVSGGGGNRPPTAEANGPYSGAAGSAASFSSNGSGDTDGSIASFVWSFGDGGTAATANPTHTYAAGGSYTVRLTVTDNAGATATDSATAVITAGGGGGNQPPVAQAGGPYFGTAGTPVLFSGAGSSDPDGSVVGYAWSFGDGGTGTGVAPQHVYSAAGTFVATLTVTDNQGATAQATANVNVAASGGGTPFVWSSSWSGTPQRDSIVTLTVQLDLSTDIPETPGAEELQSFVVDSLRWNPAVLQYFAYNHGPGGYGSVQTSIIPDGRLIIQGSLGATNRSGVITIATIRFKVLAAAGASTTTSTALGALTGTAATGGFSYRSRVRIQEATLTTQ
jgi:PKD repeat protein